MNGQQLKKLRNRSIKRALFKPENIEPLEEILNEKLIEYGRLKKLKENRGITLDKPTNEELTDYLDQIKPIVDDFLDVKGIEKPSCGYTSAKAILAILGRGLLLAGGYGYLGISALLSQGINATSLLGLVDAGLLLVATSKSLDKSVLPGYLPFTKRIFMGIPDLHVNAENVPSVVAHEYTHHIQFKTVRTAPLYRCFMEGHARGVQRFVGNVFAEKYDHELLRLHDIEHDVGEVGLAYMHLCRIFGKEPRESLVRVVKPVGINQYAIGNSLMLIKEAEEGTGIYKKMINGEYDWK